MNIFPVYSIMSYNERNFRRLPPVLLASVLSAALVTAGFSAEQPAGPSRNQNAAQNATTALISRLAERGVISREDAADLLLAAEADAAETRAQYAMAQAALAQAMATEARAKSYAMQAARTGSVAAGPASLPTPSPVAAPGPVVAPAGNSIVDTSPLPAAAAMPSAPAGEAVLPGTVRVTYVPEVVKQQIREEIKQEVMQQARDENWAAPRTLPEWINRFSFFGDFRLRFESITYPEGNDVQFGSTWWNFNAINTASAPYDYTGVANAPYPNLDQNRTRVRLRARMGAALDLSEGFLGGLRLATGENSSPITQNQTLGASGGNFSKYAVWLDRAFLKYEMGGRPDNDFSISAGRFDNPFYSTSMIWADDIGFDGLAAKWKFPLGEAATPFLTAGAFPVYNTDLNYGTGNPNKFKSYDKWLYAAQLGTDLELSHDITFKIAGAYYYFHNIEGRVSTPFTPLVSSDPGDTDASRPSFAQKGNTYIALRDIAPDSTNSFGQTNQWQYFGLATPFQEIAVTGQLDFNYFAPFQISFFGEFVNNNAFHRKRIGRNGPENLTGPVNNNKEDGRPAGGDVGWNAGVKIGQIALQKRGDWNSTFGYRRIESDAVVDGFNDSDFGGGGTNVRGFYVNANLALAKRVWLSAKWMSASQIIGPVFKNDILQIDLHGKF